MRNWRLPGGFGSAVAMVVQALLAGAVETVAAGLPLMALAAAFVFVVGGDVADRPCKRTELYSVRTLC